MRRLPQNSCARAAGQQRQRYGGSFSRLRARTPVSYGSQGARVVCIQFRCCACYGSRGSARNDGPVRLYPIFPVFFFLVLLTSTRSPSATEETTLISSRLVWTKQVVLDLLHDSRSLLFVYNPNTRRPRKTSLGGSLANSIQFYSRVVPALAATLASN
jgi:hypothetical protein